MKVVAKPETFPIINKRMTIEDKKYKKLQKMLYYDIIEKK